MKWLRRLGVYNKQNDSDKSENSQESDTVLDLTDPELIADFRNVSDDIKVKQSVCPLKNGGLLLLEAEDIRAVFTNPLFSNQPSRYSALAPKNKDKYIAASVAANIPPFLDAEEHVEVRRWLTKAFFDRVKVFDPKIDVISSEYIQRLDKNQQYSLVEHLARDFVTETMAQFVGVYDSKENIKEYTSALFRLFAPARNAEVFEKTNEALLNARDGLLKELASRRLDKAPCLLTTMDQAPVAFCDESRRDLMIVDNALLILADGIENVEAAIGLVMTQWLEQGKKRGPISTDFVRKCIHQDTPGQTIPRIAKTDMSINGQAVREGTPVFLSLASANNSLSAQEGVSFGLGRHKCIGERLAISMITSFCNALIKSAPQIDCSELTYASMFGHKWPRNIKISLDESRGLA